MDGLVAVRLPAGDVWHALAPGDLETLCGRWPLPVRRGTPLSVPSRFRSRAPSRTTSGVETTAGAV